MKDKYVLITGGTGGLGISVTKLSLAEGAKQVILPYRTAKSSDDLKAHLSPDEIDRLELVAADLNDETTVESLINRPPRLDVLIHLVGGFQAGKTDEFGFEDWQRQFQLNLHNTFLLCKHSLRRMRETGYGRIVTVGSRGVEQPAANLAAYSASKAGVIALIRSIAQETREKDLDITANAVLPSVIDTPKNRKDMGEENAWQWVAPESLARVIGFLASDAARDIRGAAIPVYGKA